ncbi:alkaline phosphatase D family protein [Desertibaculum subflavum]|uniref:alkaline phosphatase D family protein n=1 Tax=Desertibaculum subflavum TaxID=2268458 RepID=UPI000E666091
MLSQTRRGFVLSGSAAILAACATRTGRLARNPFTLGVASGEPSADGFVLWTRLAPDPLAGGGMPETPVEVSWAVAEDEGFRRVVREGKALATPDWAHSVHVELKGLEPDRWYFYRFRLPEAESPIGRARTTPAAGAGDKLRVVFASCQRWEVGYYGAWRHAAKADPDLILHLGDYIYEYQLRGAQNYIRTHDADATFTLADYRNRYALYKLEPELQAAHAACPWVVTWDDHEVVNDYANDRPERQNPGQRFLDRRAAAYKAYYEHMPLRAAQRPTGPDLQLYRTVDYGGLARFHVLDDRQYRSHQVCKRPDRDGGSNTVGRECADRLNTDLTLLGREQEAWLARQLTGSTAAWNVLAQQTLIATADWGGGRFWTDGWDGYPAARQRLVDVLGSGRVRNPVVIGGDVHTFYAADIHARAGDPSSPIVAPEFIGSSITSLGLPQRQIDQLRPHNPHIKLARSDIRGFALVEMDRRRTAVSMQTVDNALQRDSGISTLARYVVEERNPRMLTA